MFKEVVLKDSVEISAAPEKIWDFFANLEKNYKAWHPESHFLLRYLKGNPHEKGSIVYAEEILGGKMRKIKMLCTNAEKYRKVDYEMFFPLPIFHPKSLYV